jgi:hypothetical protein
MAGQEKVCSVCGWRIKPRPKCEAYEYDLCHLCAAVKNSYLIGNVRHWLCPCSTFLFQEILDMDPNPPNPSHTELGKIDSLF